MKKAVIVYYSATGNTQMMADAIADALDDSGIEYELFNVTETNAETIKDASLFFLGSPAMGVEEIEEYEFRPFFDELKSYLSGKPVVLFGSFDWGDEEWMNHWEQEVSEAGGILSGRFTVNLTPEDEYLTEMKREVSEIVK